MLAVSIARPAFDAQYDAHPGPATQALVDATVTTRPAADLRCGKRRAGDEKRAGQVDTDDVVPSLRRVVGHRCRAADAVGQHEHVEPAERRDGVRDGALRLGGIAGVGGKRTARPPPPRSRRPSAERAGPRPTSATAHPSAARSRAIAAPIPVPAPVTRAARASVTRGS